MNPSAAAFAIDRELEEGVHRFPLTLFGHDVWIVADWTGQVVGVRAALPKDSGRVIRELEALAGIKPEPSLKLIDPDRPASRASVLLAAAIQHQQHRPAPWRAPPQ